MVVAGGVEVGGNCPFGVMESAFSGVVGMRLDLWTREVSVWGVSGSTTTRIVEVSMKMLYDR